MKFKDIKANFRKIEFHKPTSKLTGVGIQMTGNLDGSVNIQMAKQLTNNPTTYAWTDDKKMTIFNLSASEIRELYMLIQKALKGKVRLFKEGHNRIFQNNDPGFDNFKKYHQNKTNSKTILCIFKEWNGNIQMELNVVQSKNGTNTNFMFNFTKQEMFSLLEIFSSHQAREMPIPEGYYSCVMTSDKEIIKQGYMPPLNIGDSLMINKNGSTKKYKILNKVFVFSKNITVYQI